MSETEWMVVCANGHRTYERVRDVHPEDVRWTDCACGATRRGELLPPVQKPDEEGRL